MLIDGRFTIVHEKNFVEATRSSGYRSTASALSELIDNAFQAEATEVVIHVLTARKTRREGAKGLTCPSGP